VALGLPSDASRAGTVLAFDFGSKRIGIAVGDTTVMLAHPLATIASTDDGRRFAAIDALIREWRPACLVVGLPTHADGTEHDMTRRSRRFARRLEGRFGLRVELVDERFTTQAAGSSLRESGLVGRAQTDVRDQVAAQFILQAYLDQLAAGSRAP
jgi:putative pre-16S rRNA nuclease